MNENYIPESELIINPNGTIYHLELLPEQLADIVITVGDPDRVGEVSKYFDRIEFQIHHRELVTHTGYLNNKRLSVVSTGMGTDNIDIVLTELDALANIDFATRTPKKELTSLQIIRLGTSGGVSEELGNDEIIITETAFGLDTLMHYYPMEQSIQETVYLESFANYMRPHFPLLQPYIATGDTSLLDKFGTIYKRGTTITAPGFYAPQGRQLRAKTDTKNLISLLQNFRHKHFRITNFEMETSGIYGLGKALGHRCLSVNALVANRVTQKFSTQPEKTIQRMIEQSLELITT